MKGFGVLVLASAALLTVCSGDVFDDKLNAIKDIETRYKSTVRLSRGILNAAESERQNINTKGESALLEQLKTKINESIIQLEKDAKAVIRTAIVKAKPVTVIHCIRNVSLSGNRDFDNLFDQFKEKVVQIRFKKIQKLDFDAYVISAIMQGLEELIDQAKIKLNEGGIITLIKKEAIQNCQSADLLLQEIELSLYEPNMSKEYIKLRQEIDRSLTALLTELNAKFDKCINS